MLIGIDVGVIWFAAFLITHVGLFHLRSIDERSKTIATIFVGAVMGCLASSAITPRYGGGLDVSRGGSVMAAISGVLVMLSLFVLYMPFYYTIATSISVQMLIAIQQAPTREMPLIQLKAMYVSKDLLQQRLEAMVRSGLLLRDDSGLRPTRKGRRIAWFFNTIKVMWRLGPGG